MKSNLSRLFDAEKKTTKVQGILFLVKSGLHTTSHLSEHSIEYELRQHISSMFKLSYVPENWVSAHFQDIDAYDRKGKLKAQKSDDWHKTVYIDGELQLLVFPSIIPEILIKDKHNGDKVTINYSDIEAELVIKNIDNIPTGTCDKSSTIFPVMITAFLAGILGGVILNRARLL